MLTSPNTIVATAAEFTNAVGAYDEGTVCITSDTEVPGIKIADGTTHWSGLPYLAPEAGPAIKWNALIIADDTPVDGTATSIDVLFYEGVATVSLGTLTDVLMGFFQAEYVGRDHTAGTLYTPTDSGPWVEAPVTSGELVFFGGINSLAIAVSQTGPDGLDQAGVPAQQVNLNNTNAARVYSNTTWTHVTPTTDVPHDPSGLSLEAWMRGVNAGLGSRGAPIVDVDWIVTVQAADIDDLLASVQPHDTDTVIVVDFQGDESKNGIYWGRTAPHVPDADGGWVETDPGDYVSWLRVTAVPTPCTFYAHGEMSETDASTWNTYSGRFVWQRHAADTGGGTHGTWLVNDD